WRAWKARRALDNRPACQRRSNIGNLINVVKSIDGGLLPRASSAHRNAAHCDVTTEVEMNNDPLISRRSLLATTGVAALAAGVPLGAAAASRTSEKKVTKRPGARPPTLRNTRGKILYINDDGTERGREWFSVTWRRDGQVTLRAYCEIDDGEVERDVVQTMTSE